MDLAEFSTPLDTFFYTGDEFSFEDLSHYKQNGLHPIILGDILPKPATCASDPGRDPRYRIMLKLGRGAFATVWLARDLAVSRFVSIKIGLGTQSLHRSNETEILSKIQEIGREKRGYTNILLLYDEFVVKGPNGFHECLVTEVVAPLLEPKIMQERTSDVVCQLVEGFAFLHEIGIAHGDPHIGNLGVALPHLDRFEEDDVIDYFSNPELVPVVPRDPLLPMQSLPPYLVGSVNVADFLVAKKAFPTGAEVTVKILDFGRAHWMKMSTESVLGAAPREISPPETILCEQYGDKNTADSTWDQQADIWAVGCTLYNIQFGTALMNTFCSSSQFLSQILKLGGPAPQAWIERWNPTEIKDNASDGLDRDSAWEASEGVNFSAIKQDQELFIDLIKKMVVTNPEGRQPMSKLLSHPFLRRMSIGNISASVEIGA